MRIATNDQCTFPIPAIPGDTIQFSIVGYYARTIVVQGTGEAFSGVSLYVRFFVPVNTVVVTPGLTACQQDALERRDLW